MDKPTLIKKLNWIASRYEGESAQVEALSLLLEYINDDEITEAMELIK
jgi:hypothetical protein